MAHAVDRKLKDAFEVVELANELLPMPTEEALTKTGDAAAYAKAYVGFARAFSEATLRALLEVRPAIGLATARRKAEIRNAR